ncbi:bifunctional 2-keto-4-hydroxyglutarate aldolase/2-keto-3-deoxy-6-phosphogluconate aldolase [Alicyclobacillus fastidiosus]|uniref:Bifunctional 2-keto-4-hydroxyglutarate aldolase/2-keto-3-deoxy-6-phosphogluconate aldolase n=1 Tax=Alicyclobacillus fastidiosus TaxID=392011 RepID=A0ABV5AC11_9BACL|nr:bifunctional 2-keto-4-hydroxyglutarate aldolase/2-keto-3-deoxy-6-phosphogluconate aldolase [Alicyclobacillus fastidiosus]WEH10275.1 bifunctional 2-keto-4-hydroxyglutarate aldolase/2-keto-3-deoxy-6-phosphogluconate aldolase [Alicyclobacillus fastidiosus]
MQSIRVMQKIIDRKVIAVIRESTLDTALAVVDAAVEGGMDMIELTMTTPDALRAIETVRKKYDGQATIGAGTVLDNTTARQAILAGAEFVVSPAVDVETIRNCHLYQIPVIPGVSNIQGTIEALQLGCGVVKLFPSSLFHPGAIKAFKGPLPQAEFIPTGGVAIENLLDWLQVGAIAVGIGSDLSKQAKESNDMRKVTEYAKRVVETVNDYKAG